MEQEKAAQLMMQELALGLKPAVELLAKPGVRAEKLLRVPDCILKWSLKVGL